MHVTFNSLSFSLFGFSQYYNITPSFVHHINLSKFMFYLFFHLENSIMLIKLCRFLISPHYICNFHKSIYLCFANSIIKLVLLFHFSIKVPIVSCYLCMYEYIFSSVARNKMSLTSARTPIFDFDSFQFKFSSYLSRVIYIHFLN